jgi:hypothetical protein
MHGFTVNPGYKEWYKNVSIVISCREYFPHFYCRT